jgi:hypothetical protein
LKELLETEVFLVKLLLKLTLGIREAVLWRWQSSGGEDPEDHWNTVLGEERVV